MSFEEKETSFIERKSEYKAKVLKSKITDKIRPTLEYIGDKYPRLDLNSAIHKAGDEGRYQKLVYLNAVLILFSASFTIYTINYIIPDPVPYC